MAQVIADARKLMNSTPLGDRKLFVARADHVAFLERLAAGNL